MTFSFLSFLLGVSLGGTLGVGFLALFVAGRMREVEAQAYRDGMARGLHRSRQESRESHAPSYGHLLLFARPNSCDALPYLNPLGGSPVTEAS